jgi:L-aminopeptidase/D-esterase-like protein
MKTGPLNLIIDVAGLHVGNAEDSRLRSGVTAILFEQAAVAAVDVRGGVPGRAKRTCSRPRTRSRLSMRWYSRAAPPLGSTQQPVNRRACAGRTVDSRSAPRGCRADRSCGDHDLLNSGNKDWGTFAPCRELGVAAVDAARLDFPIGSSGAGLGATTADLRGGLGSASAVSPEGYSVGGLVVVNAMADTCKNGDR